jgi:hypothetical protein
MTHEICLQMMLRVNRHIVVDIDTVQYVNVNHTAPTNTDPHYSKALPSKMDHFRYSLSNTDEITSLKKYFSNQGDATFNPSSFSDQVADTFYQQIIDTENYNTSSTILPDTITVDVNHNNLNLSFYDPSDLLANNFVGKSTHLVFYTDTVQYANINHTVPTNTDPHYSKALLSKIDY